MNFILNRYIQASHGVVIGVITRTEFIGKNVIALKTRVMARQPFASHSPTLL